MAVLRYYYISAQVLFFVEPVVGQFWVVIWLFGGTSMLLFYFVARGEEVYVWHDSFIRAT